MITEGALADLTGIAEYIAIDSPQNAGAVIDDLLRAIESLDRLSTRFKVVGRRKSNGVAVHAMVVRPFIVYYSVEAVAKGVFIHTVRHGRRRQPRRFP